MQHDHISVDRRGETLHFLRLSGMLYCRSECTAPWGLELPPLPQRLMVHVVTAGPCWLGMEGCADRALQPGEVILVPHGEGHRLMSAPGVSTTGLFDIPRQQVSERYEILRLDGGGNATRMMCGVMRFDHPAATQFIKLLPRVIRVAPWQVPSAEWMSSALRLLEQEARQLQLGGETVITRLADIIVIHVLRAWMECDPAAQHGWLGALRDAHIGEALWLIHHQTAQAWTVASLAHAVGMSRAAFAARFSALVGEPVMRYVTRWRMYMALSTLQEEAVSLSDVANSLGYQSEAAFSRTFKRFIGMSPGAARKKRP